MASRSANVSLGDVGYRRVILLCGVLWGVIPALSYGVRPLLGWSTPAVLVSIGALMTVSLGVLYELDSRELDAHGSGVPLAWAYALVAPLSVVFWFALRPGLAVVPGGQLLALLVGPPASVLLYLWQRGRVASVSGPDS